MAAFTQPLSPSRSGRRADSERLERTSTFSVLPRGKDSSVQMTEVSSPHDHYADASLRALLAGSADGDRTAFAKLYDLTSARIYGLVLRVIRDTYYAEEVVQEAFLQFWQQARLYEPDRGSVMTWMMTIAHRRAIDRVRTEELQRSRIVEAGIAQASITAPLPLEVVIDTEEAREVHACLHDLTALQRSSIEMSYLDGMTYPEVAAATGTPLPTIKSRIRDGCVVSGTVCRSATDGLPIGDSYFVTRSHTCETSCFASSKAEITCSRMDTGILIVRGLV